MAEGELRKIKLISLDVIEFKTLSRGKLSLKHEDGKSFSVINVKNFDEHSTIFQAFQFGFGHETAEEKAAVTVTLQQSSDDNSVRNLHFSHFKSPVYGHQYKVKVDGVDASFQVVDKQTYFARLDELKVFSATELFFLGSGCKNATATINIDLRPFLEMYLMNRIVSTNEYEDIEQNLERLNEQKRTFQKMSKVLTSIEKDFTAEVEVRKQKAKAEQGERDMLLLQLFYHHKILELMRETDDDLRVITSRFGDIEREEMMKRFRDLESQINKTLMDQFIMGMDLSKPKNDIVRQIQESKKAMVDEETAFQLSIHPFIDQFSRLYIQHESEHLDLRIELDDAKFYLEQAKIDKRLNDIVCDEKTRLFESKLGADFIGVVGHSPDDDPKIFDDVMDDLKNLDRVLNSHTFKIPKGLKLDAVRSHIDLIPKIGHFTVETFDEQTFNHVRKILKDDKNDPANGQRKILHRCYAWFRPDIKPIFHSVRGSRDKAGLSDQFSFSSYHEAQILKEVDAEMRQMTDKLKEKPYQVDVKEKNKVETNEKHKIDQQVEKREEKLKEVEAKLASKYRDIFGSILEELGVCKIDESDPKEIIDAVDLCKRYRNAFNGNQQVARAAINELEDRVVELAEIEQKRIDQAQKVQAQKISENSSNVKDLFEEGKAITAQVNDFLKKSKSDLLFNEAFRQNKLLTIQYLAVKAQKLKLPFDPANETSSRAYLDCIGDENKPLINANERSILKIHEVVAAKINAIKDNLHLLELKDEYTHFNDDALTLLKTKARKENAMKKKELATEGHKLRVRNTDFAPRFREFHRIFEEFANYCHEKWGMSLKLDFHDDSILEHPIRLFVRDKQLDAAYQQTTTLSHHAAAFILQLALNKTVGSPILIIDSLEYLIEPDLIGAITKLLTTMVEDGIQVIFMLLHPQKEEPNINSFRMWTDESAVEQIAETTDITAVDEQMSSESSTSS